MANVCDYRDTDYKTDFWGSGQRDYEDLAERLVLRKLLPLKSGSILEIGGGFGRLMDEYVGRFDRAVLFDYASNLLDQARKLAGDRGYKNIEIVQGSLYDMEHVKGKFDYVQMVRVMHHIEDVPAAFKEISKKLNPGGVLIMEYANKRNLLEILRLVLLRTNLRPFDRSPSRRGEKIFYNFHPAYIRENLEKAGFVVEQELMVSMFRSRLLKKLFGARFLAKAETVLQSCCSCLKLSPSIFVKAVKK